MRSTSMLVLTVSVVMPLAACAQEPEALPPATGQAASQSVTSTTSASPTKDPELVVVEERAKTYMDTEIEIATNPDKAIDDISLVARGDASGMSKRVLQQLRAEGMTASGTYTWTLRKSRMLKPAERPRATAEFCGDGSDYVLKDAKGKSRNAKTATSVRTNTLEKWGDTWYVTKSTSEPARC